ncbi:MAG: hypothetical protein KDD42_01370 [Bdellovibrionales bacterium]|nr:hypothetical protein [Bdellovibrionales bacterium]
MYWQHSELILRLHLLLGWISMTLGILSGATIGIFFHRESWLGGYDTVARRMIRLGHISFFGMAFFNFSFVTTLLVLDEQIPYCALGSIGLVLATVSMPLICFLSARWGISRAIFSIPVLSTFALALTVLAAQIGFGMRAHEFLLNDTSINSPSTHYRSQLELRC